MAFIAQIKEELADNLMSKLTLVGDGCVYVDGVRKIVLYSAERVELNCSMGKNIFITGKNMQISCLSERELKLVGNIECVSTVKNE